MLSSTLPETERETSALLHIELVLVRSVSATINPGLSDSLMHHDDFSNAVLASARRSEVSIPIVDSPEALPVGAW